MIFFENLAFIRLFLILDLAFFETTYDQIWNLATLTNNQIVLEHIYSATTFVTIVTEKALLSPLMSQFRGIHCIRNLFLNSCFSFKSLCRQMWWLVTNLDNPVKSAFKFQSLLNKNLILSLFKSLLILE